MSDAKQNIDDDLLELDNVVEDAVDDDLDDLYNSDDVVPGELDDVDVKAAPADNIARKERFWLIVTITAFTLALLTSLVLVPMLINQQQRVNDATEIIGSIDVNNTEAEKAITPSGDYAPFRRNLLEADAAMQQFLVPDSFLGSLSNKVFGGAQLQNDVQAKWDSYKGATDAFLKTEAEVTAVKLKVSTLTTQIGSAVSESVGFVEAVAKEGRNKGSGTAKDKYLFLTSEASNLNGILGRLAGTVRNYFEPNQNLERLSDAQSGLMVRLQDTLNRIVSNAAAVVGTAAEPLQAQYKQLEARVSDVSDSAGALASARTAVASMRAQSSSLSEAVVASSAKSGSVGRFSTLANVLPILFALLGGFGLWRFFKLQSRDLVAQEANLSETLAEQQESILKLLDEMSALADGDLTVEAEVTDQITGAIADSVNFAVIEMRELVSQINRASLEVANESESAVNSAQSVSQSNMSQAEEITSAAQLMQRISNSMREMSEQASSSSSMATESMKVATQGATAVRDTISGMEDMREQIQDTSKRIKRLGESSQRIGDIVALIDDIAEQTNILSLNAAIQASMAGEAGRGFAVVSDEVQSLAERSTEATKKIAELVTTIQNDTNDAVLSMEKATQQVVAGTKVADTAGTALSEIEEASKTLSQLVEGISKNSNEQAEVVSRVTGQVTEVSESSSETSRKAQESANSIAKLLELAKELEASVSRFKLPAS